MSTIDFAEMLRMIDSFAKQTFDSFALHPEHMRVLRDSTAAEIQARQDADMPSLFGYIKVFESEYCRMPVRRHKRRKWMRESYHRRIQKKWTKRWGTAPAAFAFPSDVMRLATFKPLPEIRLRDLSSFGRGLSSFGGYGLTTISNIA